MKILFINPGAATDIYGKVSGNVGIEPPYWVALKAAVERQKGNDVKIIDAEAEHLTVTETVEQVRQYHPDIVEVVSLGITPSCSSTPKMTVSQMILAGIKEACPDVVRLISGIHPSALFFETWKGVDATPVHCSPSGLPSTYPVPAWDLLPMDKYRAHQWHCYGGYSRTPYASLYTSFGCPYHCDFCTIHNLYGWDTIKYHDVSRVLLEIDTLYHRWGIANIKFCDELFTCDKKRVLAICKELKKRNYGLNLWAYSHIDTVDERIVTAMLEAGFRWQCFGIESANDKVRNGIGKKFSLDKLRRQLDMVRRCGALLNGDFIFGLPEDDMTSMKQTLNFAKEYLFEFVNFYVAMAYPGSKLYERTPVDLLPKTWDAYSQYSPHIVPLPTKHLSPKQVLEFRDKAFIEYHKNPSYLKMMRQKFGKETVEEIKAQLAHPLERDLLKS